MIDFAWVNLHHANCAKCQAVVDEARETRSDEAKGAAIAEVERHTAELLGRWHEKKNKK